MIRLYFALLALFFTAGSLAQSDTTAHAPPDWYTKNIQFMTAGDGIWTADNKQFQSENETWDAYSLIWRAGPGGHSMTGRMFGIKDGERSRHDFWVFSQYWDPGTQQAVLQQYGWNSIGTGQVMPADNGRTRLQQTFIDFNGIATEHGHRTSNPSPHEHLTTSFDINEDGEWIEGRTYLWKRDNGSSQAEK